MTAPERTPGRPARPDPPNAPGPRTRIIHCCGCERGVEARLTSGREIYPRRRDLADLPFWRCDGCRNYVGCHHQTGDRIRPLGVIPTPELRAARGHIHKLLDPLWREGGWDRGRLYDRIALKLGQRGFHTAEIKSIEEARAAYRAIQAIAAEPPEGRNVARLHPRTE